MNLIGKPLPHFSLQGYCNGKEMTFNASDCKGRTTVLFFYPLDFTFVCPTELLALDAAHAEFEKRKILPRFQGTTSQPSLPAASKRVWWPLPPEAP